LPNPTAEPVAARINASLEDHWGCVTPPLLAASELETESTLDIKRLLNLQRTWRDNAGVSGQNL
jgi:hypothetical protein